MGALITEASELQRFCDDIRSSAFVTVDTEFMREKTYWPQLCLVQVAGAEQAAAIDPLAAGMDLKPLLDILDDPRVTKVMHAARQDMEIFYHLTGRLPAPLFDTQVAAMVCGFGDAVSYENLVSKLAKARIDKSSRFTDWSARPLTKKQIDYALSDVTHLRTAYEKLSRRIEDTGRASWLADEMAVLTDPATYEIDAEKAFRRLKVRSTKPQFLAVLRELAGWREHEAKTRDLPRNRILKDEQLFEIAHHQPQTAGDLARTRGLGKAFAEGKMGRSLMQAVERSKGLPEDQWPRIEDKLQIPPGLGPTTELLKVLLKMKAERHDVAQKLLASAADLDHIAALGDSADVPALKGWRRKVFGEDALRLARGEIAIGIHGKRLDIVVVRADAAGGDPN